MTFIFNHFVSEGEEDFNPRFNNYDTVEHFRNDDINDLMSRFTFILIKEGFSFEKIVKNILNDEPFIESVSVLPFWESFKTDSIEELKKLIAYGADIHKKSRNDSTSLMCACYNNTYNIVKYLLEQGLDPNVKNNQGHVALMETMNPNIVKILIKYKANVNAQDKNGNTPLMWLNEWLKYNEDREKDIIECMKILVRNGADIYIKNKQFVNLKGKNVLEMIEKKQIRDILVDEYLKTNFKNVNLPNDVFYKHVGKYLFSKKKFKKSRKNQKFINNHKVF